MNESELWMTVREKNPQPEISVKPEPDKYNLWELLFNILFFGGAVLIALFCIFYCPWRYQMGLAMFVGFGFLWGLLVERKAIIGALLCLVLFSYLIMPFVILGYIWDYFWNRYPAQHTTQNWIGVIIIFGIIASCWGMMIVGDYLMRKNNPSNQSAKLDYFDEYSSPTYTPGLFGGRWG
jgi:hypothetical protein